MSLLETRQLSRSFGGLQAVDMVDFQVRPGEILSLIGPNGAGKTTCFNCLTGLVPASSGAIRFEDRPITHLKPHQVTARGIARTFQNIRLFGEMTAWENVIVGTHPRTSTGVFGAIWLSRRVRDEEQVAARRALELLELVGLGERRHLWARNLAYGEQRRLEIARALATEPKLLLLDEPAAGMNPQEVGRLMTLIRTIRDRGVTILLIEHHMKVVMNISDRVAVLDHGVKIAEGTPAEIAGDPRVIEAYLGTDP